MSATARRTGDRDGAGSRRSLSLNDASTLRAGAFVRPLTDGIDVPVRVADDAKTLGASDAGADYVPSTWRVSARLLAREIHGEEVLAPGTRLRIVTVDADRLAGRTLGRHPSDERSGEERPRTAERRR